jgi:ribosomal protein S4E
MRAEQGAKGKKPESPGVLRDGARCQVIGGTHAGKSGTVADIKTSKTGHVTITVVQANGERFKTLARNVVVRSGDA